MLYDVLNFGGSTSGMSCILILGLILGISGADILTAWNNGNHSMVHDKLL